MVEMSANWYLATPNLRQHICSFWIFHFFYFKRVHEKHKIHSMQFDIALYVERQRATIPIERSPIVSASFDARTGVCTVSQWTIRS
jgi:hypothetical protein